jgi:hypothetical protein
MLARRVGMRSTERKAEAMSTTNLMTTQLGDLVAAVIDEAEQYSKDPREVSRLAAKVVTRIVRRGGKPPKPER